MGTWGRVVRLGQGPVSNSSEFLLQSLSIEWKIFITFTWTRLGPSAYDIYIVSRSTSVSQEEDRRPLMVEPIRGQSVA
jgi:hypothetical protein